MNAGLSCSCLAWSPAPGARTGRFALKPRGKKKIEKLEIPSHPAVARQLVEMALN
jgi:hypothetical protein